MVIYVRPEVGQSCFQWTLGSDVPLVGSEWLNKTGIDVVVGGISEEVHSCVLERPYVPIPRIRGKASIIGWHPN